MRDGRSISSSYARHHDVDFYDAVRTFGRGLQRAFPFEPDRDDVLAFRYEDLLDDPQGHMNRFRKFLNLEYPTDVSLRGGGVAPCRRLKRASWK